MEKDRSTPGKLPSPAVARAVAALDLVAAEPGKLTLTDLADRLGLAKSSMHALTTTVTRLGLLKSSDQTFAVGPYVMRWATAFSRGSDIATEFVRIWDERTVDLKGATITLSIADGDDVVCIGARNAEHMDWVELEVGMRLPMAFTATGHALLGRQRDGEIRRRYRAGLPTPMTPHSPTTLDELLGLIARTRERGYSLDVEYVSEGKTCFGAPMLGPANRTGIPTRTSGSSRSC